MALGVASVSGLLLAWELAGRFGLVDRCSCRRRARYWIPLLISSVTDPRIAVVDACQISVGRAMLAFVLAVIAGIPLGVMIGLSPIVAGLIDPFVQFLRPLPKLALIPWSSCGRHRRILESVPDFPVRVAQHRRGFGRRGCQCAAPAASGGQGARGAWFRPVPSRDAAADGARAVRDRAPVAGHRLDHVDCRRNDRRELRIGLDR